MKIAEPEFGWATVGLVVLMSALYMSISVIGIKTFNECSDVQDSTKWKNIKMAISHMLTISITMAATLGLVKFVGREGYAASFIISIAGVLTAFMTLAMTQKCKSSTDKGSKNYAIVMSAVYPILAGVLGYLLFKKAKEQVKTTRLYNPTNTYTNSLTYSR